MLDATGLCLPVEMEKEAIAEVPWAADLAEQHRMFPLAWQQCWEED